jgi:DNA invertase Pin-like site-specific DNA recombinase
VSTEEQADSGAGLAAQRAAILADAKRRGWTEADVTFIEDAGYSGKDLKRPGLQAALDALHSRKADTLVVSKLDRLSRTMVDFAGLMERVTKERWALIALDVDVDTTTASGELYANIMASLAVFERKRIGERTRDALAVKRSQGVILGRPPRVPAEVIERMRAEHRGGATLQAIADGLTADGIATAQGGRRWYPSTVGEVLRRTGEPMHRRGPRRRAT